MSSSSGEQKEERYGPSFVNSTVKTAIRALSSMKFPTPGSSAQKRNDAVGYDDAGKSARMQFAEELRSLSEDDEGLLTSVNTLFESRAGPELTSSLPNQILGRGIDDFATSCFDEGQLTEERKRNTFRNIRSAYGDNTTRSPDPESYSIGREPERRSLFDENISSSRGPPTPPNRGKFLVGSHGGNLLPVSLRAADDCSGQISQDRFPVFLPRHAEVVASEYGHSTRFGREDQANVTQRDLKRPKERTRDRAYKTRFSMSSSVLVYSYVL
jgi:hypothetical protein